MLRVRFKPTAKESMVRPPPVRTDPTTDSAAITPAARAVEVTTGALEVELRQDPKALREVVVANLPRHPTILRLPLEMETVHKNRAMRDVAARESQQIPTPPNPSRTKLKAQTIVLVSPESQENPENPKKITRRPRLASSEVVRLEENLDLLVSRESLRKVKRLDHPANVNPESQVTPTTTTTKDHLARINNALTAKATKRDPLARSKETTVTTFTEAATEVEMVSPEVAEVATAVVTAVVTEVVTALVVSTADTVAVKAKTKAATLSIGDPRDVKVRVTKTEVAPAHSVVEQEVVNLCMASSTRTNESSKV